MVNIIFSKNLDTSTGSSSSSSSSSTVTSRFLASTGSLNEVFPNGYISPTSNLKIFSFEELKITTRNFRPDMVIGEGGFGKVFKGWLDEKTSEPSNIGTGMDIAVKKLDEISLQGLKEWQSEVNFLGRLSHPNLVKLLGYCLEDKELLLVYEFMQKGSLDNHLFRRGSAIQPLPWNIRLKIAIGAARVLAFLHTSEPKVIHRDFKTSNILLDESYNPKLTDFGMAKRGPSGGDSHVTTWDMGTYGYAAPEYKMDPSGGDSHVSTQIFGTYGYAAPEYVATGCLYVKSDVYSFGVVLLELLTGLQVVDKNRPSGQHNLVEWAKPFLANKRKLKDIMDTRLEFQYPSEGALQAAELTLTCLRPEPQSRPSMKEVLEILERIENIKKRAYGNSKLFSFLSISNKLLPNGLKEKPMAARTNSRHPVPHRHSHSQHPMHHSSPLPQKHGGTGTGSRTHQYPTGAR